jgi:photosystem II stability/assembly factor-like uncharacterized protein/outer membrane lipoprotein-sorting protein
LKAAAGGITMCLLGIGMAASQLATPPQPPTADSVYLNVQVLKGIPVDQFNDTMGMFSSALLLDCVGCHDTKITSDPKAFAIATPRIQRARQMVVMMNALNRMYFGGQPRVTCFTCHGGDPQPEVSPSLRLQYGELVNDPSSFKFFPDVAAPAAETILARYLDALGGAQRLAALNSFVATGIYVGFDTSEQEVPLQVFARAPDQRTLIADAGAADIIWTHDGRRAWKYQPDTPIPLVELTGWSVTGSRIDAMVLFPASLPKAFKEWQVGYADIDGRQVEVVRGINPGESPVNLHFDTSGLLVRLVRWTQTGAGPVPVQIDYSDYREVAGVKIPFHWVTTWTNGQSTIQLNDLRPNVAIDDARFGRPDVARADSNGEIYAATSNGIFKTTNGGINWTPANAGLSGIPVFSLAIDPKTPATVYAGTFGRGMFKSTNGGANWGPSGGGFGGETALSIAIDPVRPVTLYSGTTTSTSSIDGSSFRPGSAILKTDNAGLAWTNANGGLPRVIVTALGIDPANPAILYAGTSSAGVFKTANRGLTWLPANGGINNSDISTLVVDPSNPNIVYVGIEGCSAGCSSPAGIYKSTNGGKTWVAASAGLADDLQVVALAIDPANPRNLYAATRFNGLFKTTDAGTGWVSINPSPTGTMFAIVHFALVADPAHPGTVYAGTFEGVMKTMDGGKTWMAANSGLPASTRVFALALHPQQISR